MKITAVSFSDEEATKLVKNRLRFTVTAWCCFLLCFGLGMSAAILAGTRGHFDDAVITLTCLASAAACPLIAACAINLAYTIKIHTLTRRRIAEAMYKNGEILNDAPGAEFEVTFTNEVMKLCRKGYTFQVSFDLSGIKKVYSVYSAFGEDLLEFLREYYLKKCNAGATGDVKVVDSVAGKSSVIYIVKDGKPATKPSDEYYAKKGLIK